MTGRLFAWLQHLLPARWISVLARRVSNSRLLARPMIAIVRRLYRIELDEYQVPEPGFASFDQFFTRPLKAGARNWPDDPDIITSPCDGRISQLGSAEDGRLLQAKGRHYRLDALLADPDWARRLTGGQFLTVYLAPSDYHRVHMPFAGRLLREIRVPGSLYSVSESSVQHIDRLFARNERMVALFETRHGPAAVVMVAALLVSGIETRWGGPLRPGPTPAVRDFPTPLSLERGEELGRFHWGSTVIVITAPGAPRWRPELEPGLRLRLGQPLTGADHQAAPGNPRPPAGV
ncbi:MAG: archaetidylserine decarboxylase [Wenzhouxiangellaceae bacterium]